MGMMNMQHRWYGGNDWFSGLMGIVGPLVWILLLILLFVLFLNLIKKNWTLLDPSPKVQQNSGKSQTCPNCGEKIADEFKFCPSCTASLRHECTKCGRQVQQSWKCCPYCGQNQKQS